MIGIINLRRKKSISELAVKFIVAIVLYLPITIFCLFYIASTINYIGDTKGIIVDGKRLSPSMDYQTLGLFLAYCLFGLILCWFLKTDLLKSLTKIVWKPQNNELSIKS